MTKPFYKCHPFNFVPLSRTPWAGEQISRLKRKYFPHSLDKIPDFIGESWEVSTDIQFPSQVEVMPGSYVHLIEFMQTDPEGILGEKTYHNYGAHFPLLLKWLGAKELLSVQLHPKNSNPLLQENECGKPESWLVLDHMQGGFVYLGFKKSLSKEEILNYLKKDEMEKCLHKYFPKKFDYISVPPGCVHAVGPGVLVAEPQYVLPKKIAKTWRISDWRRLYDEHGKPSPIGKPRELHLENSLSSINWDLPQGEDCENLLIQNVEKNSHFFGDENNPFALKVFHTSGEHIYKHLVENSFSIFTVWGGNVSLSFAQETLTLQGGESGFICANTKEIKVKLEDTIDKASIAFFGIA